MSVFKNFLHFRLSHHYLLPTTYVIMHRIPLWKNATRDGCIHQTGSPSTSFTRLPTRRSRVSPFSLNNCIIRSGSSIHSSSAPISSIVSSNKSQNLPSFSFFHEQDSESTKNTRDSLQQLDEINDSWSVLSTGDLNVEIESLEEKVKINFISSQFLSY